MTSSVPPGVPRGVLSRLPPAVRVLVALGVSATAGTLGMVCLASMMLQVHGGFLATQPRGLVGVLYAIGLAGCLIMPSVVWSTLLPRHRRWGLISTVAVIAVLSVPVLPLLLG